MRKDVKHESIHGTVYTDGCFRAPNGRMFTREEMKTSIKQVAHINKIYKPMSLLYYTDVMNGHKNNWS